MWFLLLDFPLTSHSMPLIIFVVILCPLFQVNYIFLRVFRQDALSTRDVSLS